MSYWPICVCRCVVQATGIYHRSLVEGSDALRVEITSTGWSSRRFFLGGEGVTWRRDPSQVPQNWKLRGFRPLFFGRSQNSLSKKWRNIRFATGTGGPQNHRKYDRSWYFWCRRKMCVFYVFQLVLNRLWMRKHPIAGRFWNSEDNFEILNLRKRKK